jgi:membrane-bound lytic murein transglycosylase MltF
MWAQVLPRITVRDDLVLRSEGVTGWAIRKDSPKLEAAILDFYANYLKKQGVIDYRLAQFHKRVKQISNNADREELTSFEATLDLFKRYGGVAALRTDPGAVRAVRSAVCLRPPDARGAGLPRIATQSRC